MPSVADVRTWGQRVALIVVDVLDDCADPVGSRTVVGAKDRVGIAHARTIDAGSEGEPVAGLGLS